MFIFLRNSLEEEVRYLKKDDDEGHTGGESNIRLACNQVSSSVERPSMNYSELGGGLDEGAEKGNAA